MTKGGGERSKNWGKELDFLICVVRIEMSKIIGKICHLRIILNLCSMM